MAEWFKAAVLKTAVPETVPGVRIPPPPPHVAPRERASDTIFAVEAERRILPAAAWVMLGLGAVALVSVAELIAGPSLGLVVFNAAAVAAVAAALGRKPALAVGLSAVAWHLGIETAGPSPRPLGAALEEAVVLLAALAVLAAVVPRRLAQEKDARATDRLTGARSLKFFWEIAEREAWRSRRHLDPLTLAYLACVWRDRDRLAGQPNALHLREVAQTIQSKLRATDVLARIGPDGFLLLLPEAGREGARTICDKLHQLLKETARAHGWAADFTMGVVTFKRPAGSIDDMVKMAEAVMFAGREDGKSAVAYEAI